MGVRLTAPVPPQLPTRSLAAPSLLARVLSEKLCDGGRSVAGTRLRLRLDRGTMCR